MKPVSETHSWWPSSELAVVPLCCWTSIRKVTGFSTNSKLFIKNILYIDVGILFPVDRVFHVWRLGRRGAESKQEKVDMEMFKPPKFLSCLPSGTHGLIVPPTPNLFSHLTAFSSREGFGKSFICTTETNWWWNPLCRLESMLHSEPYLLALYEASSPAEYNHIRPSSKELHGTLHLCAVGWELQELLKAGLWGD